jgi:hypothetical protein
MAPSEEHIDPRLKDWATEREAEIIDAVNFHGSAAKPPRHSA